MNEYLLTRIWVDRLGWPVTWYRNRPITNFIRWMMISRGRDWWYRSADGGCYPVRWVKQPNGAVTPIMVTGRSSSVDSGLPLSSQGGGE